MIRLTAGLGLSLILAAGLLAAKTAEERRLRATITVFQHCEKAVGGDRHFALDACPPAIFGAATTAAAAVACDRDLQILDVGVPMSCTPGVGRAVAQRDAFTGQVADLTQQLNQARTDQVAAVNRAVARERAAATRNKDAEAVVTTAPRNDRGLVVLDAGRLCQLSACEGPRPDR